VKYCRIVAPGTPSDGAFGRLLDDGRTIELVEGDVLPSDRPLAGGRTVAVDEVATWLAPVVPPNIVALGKNYAEHAKEGFGGDVPAEPIIFLKATTSLTGHLQPILLPRDHADEVDYEAELVVVIGHRAKRVSRADALKYVFGYACGHDVSARDCQIRIDRQWARGKSFDTFCPVGPFVETDADVSNLRVRMLVNGEVVQDDTTASMTFDVPAIVEHLSAAMTLLPGTLVMTGTPAGVGFARTPPRFLREGDVARVEIEQIGALENRVSSEG
jgi:2-keto-4-pentenoate hydratase/2-oxohepta-3-ene-1,7-dioic acid hydratase in catechol pathway